MPETVPGLWQAAWQLPPVVVGVATASVVLVILATAATWQAAASRLAVIVVLVVMLSGLHRQRQLPASAANGPTLQLVDLVMPAVAVVGEPITAEAIAWQAGSGESSPADRPAMVELLDEAGMVLDRAAAEPTADATAGADTATGQGRLWRAELTWQPAEAGVQQRSARWNGRSAASDAAAPSAELLAVCGVVERPLRVLLIDAAARWETRHLIRLLRGTPAVEATLVVLDSAAVEQLPRSRQAAAAFDVVVLGSFDPRDLPEAAAQALVNAAKEDGLGVLWSLDGRSDLASLAASPLGVLLPCSPAPLPSSLPATRGHRVWPTAAAAGLRWLAPLLQAIEQTQAEVFFPASIAAQRGTAIAPLMLSTAAAPAVAGTPAHQPAMLVDHSPAGRVVALLCETWRFRIAGSSDAVDAFWRSALRFVAEPRLQHRMGAELITSARAADAARRQIRQAVVAAAERTAQRQRQPLWNHPAVLATVIVLSAVSWLLPPRRAALTTAHAEPRGAP
mgnify:CR=1 FL=1